MSRLSFEPVAGSEQLFRYDDCCAVYLLKHGHRGTLIDLGSGVALSHLKEVGVTEIEAVLFTHAHRDQCQGAARAAALGIPLRFPEAARALIDPAVRTDLRPPGPLVGVYPGRFDPAPPIPEARFDVQPGQWISWAGGELEVLAIPGHSPDQVAFLADMSDLRVAFCGDALHSPGKLHEPYHLETDHYTGAGCRQAAESLRHLKNARPTALCPSHGPVTVGDLWQTLEGTIRAVLRLADLKDTICPGRPAAPRLVPPLSNHLFQLSEHLLLWNNSYFLLSDAGPVLMVDCGEPLSEEFHRQWREMVGERQVESVLITHIHCDHVDGIDALQAEGGRLGRKRKRTVRSAADGQTPAVWALDSLEPLLARPHAYRRPFLPNQPTRVDRVLADPEEFDWQEYGLHAFDFPGQTDLHACYATAVDGRRVVFSGDNFYPPQQWGGTGGLSGLNGGHPLKGWQSSINLLLELQPDWLLAAHVQPFPFRRADFEAMLTWVEDVSRAMRVLAPDGCLERHFDPHLFGLLPYCQTLEGKSVPVTACVLNPYPHPIEAHVGLVLPPGWRVSRARRRLTVPARGAAGASWTVSVDDPGPDRAAMLALDVIYEGEYLGQKAECYVFW